MATISPVSKAQFLAGAPKLKLALTLEDGTPVVDDNGNPVTYTLKPREFGTGSFGYGAQGKAAIPIEGVEGDMPRLQISANWAVVGSKERNAQDGVPAAGKDEAVV